MPHKETSFHYFYSFITKSKKKKFQSVLVTDPGFPRRGVANLEYEAKTLLFGKSFAKKLNEHERRWIEKGGGAHIPNVPIDPPMVLFDRSMYISCLWLIISAATRYSRVLRIPWLLGSFTS